MLNLIFFTSNQTKLAHLRYLAESYPIKIQSFKQKTYYASYEEPRLYNREELFKESYKSALNQANKSGIDTKSHFFFFEDTSVRIDCLSDSEKEIPGVDIKYWMQSQDFNSVDEILKNHKNNRKVRARSDILLHIPDDYRKKFRLDLPYKVFVGYQDGYICEQEHNFESNLVFPWLDNKTFNKWFIPVGEDKPISQLPISKADNYDFRKYAFLKMYNFLNENNLLYNVQMPLSLNNIPILVVCGFACSGKTTISQYLIKKFNYTHIEASDFMHSNCYQRNGVQREIKISNFAEQALKAKPHIVAESIADYINDFPNEKIIISGFRSIDEIIWLQGFYKDIREIDIIIIDAQQEIRYGRYNERNRDGLVNFEDFKEIDGQQKRMGLTEIVENKSYKKINNDKSFPDFFTNFESSITLNKKGVYDEKLNLNFSTFEKQFDNISIEERILIGLLSKWEYDECREYYSTTQVNKICESIFPKLQHARSTFTRYFNRDFYPLYEISISNQNIKKYRLSNTGFGKAMQVYHKIKNKLT